MEAKVNIGHFQLVLLILNVEGRSPLSDVRPSDCGSFGKIYFKKFNEENVAVKSFFFDDQNKNQVIEAVIKECSLLKISSVLKCAPAVGRGIGFDILVYDDCIQFLMEKGLKVTSLNKKDSLDLFNCLAKLHAFKIIHFDIKPPNICYNPRLKTFIFIDFGFTDIVS
jgi:serine/threonine protein kinase